MKQFALFAGDHYYPSGGWGDFVGYYDSVREALLEVKNAEKDINRDTYDWWEVVDLAKELVVERGTK